MEISRGIQAIPTQGGGRKFSGYHSHLNTRKNVTLLSVKNGKKSSQCPPTALYQIVLVRVVVVVVANRRIMPKKAEPMNRNDIKQKKQKGEKSAACEECIN